MSDVNVMIIAVDEAIDLLEKYRMELSDIYASGLFDLNSTEELTRRTCIENQSKIDSIQDLLSDDDNYEESNYENEAQRAQLLELYCKQNLFEALNEETVIICDEKRNDWSSSYRKYTEIIDEGKKTMLEYIVKLNEIALSGSNGEGMGWNNTNYYVVIVDSNKYPQTAEHIRWAIKKGMPEFVTLGRNDASQRRKDSLRGIKRSSVYDRDEWPMACFEEGGSGADVFYIEGADNRGAGSSIGRQMSRIPDGSRIRMRII